MGRGSHGKIASTAAIEVYTEEHKKLKHKLCFLGETEGEVVGTCVACFKSVCGEGEGKHCCSFFPQFSILCEI